MTSVWEKKKNGMNIQTKKDKKTDRQMDRKIEDNETVKKAKRAGQSDKKRYTYTDIKTEQSQQF